MKLEEGDIVKIHDSSHIWEVVETDNDKSLIKVANYFHTKWMKKELIIEVIRNQIKKVKK